MLERQIFKEYPAQNWTGYLLVVQRQIPREMEQIAGGLYMMGFHSGCLVFPNHRITCAPFVLTFRVEPEHLEASSPMNLKSWAVLSFLLFLASQITITVVSLLMELPIFSRSWWMVVPCRSPRRDTVIFPFLSAT